MFINELQIQIIRKPVKHLCLRIKHPDGQVHLTAPRHVSDAEAKRFILAKWDWIKEKQALFIARPDSLLPHLVSGDCVYFMGRSCRLMLAEASGRPQVYLGEGDILYLQTAADASLAQKQALLDAWYRMQLKRCIPPLIEKWEAIMGERVQEWRIKRMKTRWGTCNAAARRIWLSLELIKKHPDCLEYVIVHEMVHFFERLHNARFKALMDAFLPNWRLSKAKLLTQ